MVSRAALRPATPEDLAALVALHLDTVLVAYRDWFPSDADPPDPKLLADRWAEDVPRTVVAEVDGAIVGSVVARPDGDLARLHVLPSRWGRGIGAALHDAAVGALRSAGHASAGLWVIAANERARAFYERRGWIVDPGRELDEAGVAEVRYVLTLSSSAPARPRG